MLLLAHAFKRERAWLLAHGEARAPNSVTERFDALCAERKTGMPIAYVLGSGGFYGREFAVDRRVLVPRPETERLIDVALLFLHERRNADPRRRMRVLDVGVGSGAIACTIAAENPNVLVDGTDVSPGALEVARSNAQKLGVGARCRLRCGRYAQPVAGRRYDVILANLPYVATAEIPPVPSALAFEPREALDGGADGLDSYREFVPAAPGAIEPGGLMLLEAAPEQMAGLERLVARAFPAATIEIGADFAGDARYLKVTTAMR